ncbi:penicillin-binding protein 2 [Isoptericola variabilis]|uniref:Peptidoglycan glycosyltransferase n=1 Tax=Isoptericola variabilis (strain 225) TaxID=743718 RepID=F6FQ86_ISOV2|nr:penicillin-binding protein 2 [Isoptericola variabilis]AEG42839.1 Peptidoglycan glycosyltransferase [Isoptericola variabilis 225]TWH30979.1 peptidoglycan glycosyltransferase [Isoptericola variabilis J7]
MNTTLRRLASVVMVMFVALMVSTTWIQFFQAGDLNDDNRNVRKIYAEYGTARGPIVVGGEAIAYSTPVDDEFGYQRQYADGPLYASLTGYFSLVSGTSKIEDTENDFLNGRADALWVDRLQNLLTGADPQGSSVELTIDPAAQRAAWDALGDQRGAVVAIEPSTGRILAMVSKPSFDPNQLATHDTTAATSAYEDLANAEDQPLLSRATNWRYPPGSTFKLITAAAAIESGRYDAGTVIPAPETYTPPGTDRAIPNYGGTACSPTDEQSLADALRISCNTAFAQLGVELGDEALREQADAFGFNEAFDVPFRTVTSVFPEPPFDRAFAAQAAIGQWDVTATPLQVAMVSAAIANDGELMAPYAVDRIRDPELEVVRETSPQRMSRPISSTTADQLTDMMVGVVQDGSGTSAQIPGVTVAGKTGTAQWQDGRDPHAWFTAFAPAEDPQVAVAVVVEQGGSSGSEATGGRVAAPVAKAVIEAVLNG